MKKYTIYLMLCTSCVVNGFLYSCGPTREEYEELKKHPEQPDEYSKLMIATGGYKLEIIDGCEYLSYKIKGYDATTHKGNCKACREYMRSIIQSELMKLNNK